MRARHLGLVAATALLGACGPKTDLDPLPGARRVRGLDEGVAVLEGDVRVVLQTADWPGPTPIQQEVTPVRVVLDNLGDQPVAVRYVDFALVTPAGEALVAIPPFEAEGTVDQAVVVTAPTFGYHGFWVAPYYGPIYPTMSPWRDPFAWDPWVSNGYGTATVRTPLPSADMIASALPEGVLEPGGHLDGWLYFPGIPRDAETVTFRADLFDPTTGVVDARIRVPFDAG